ncbi:MAG: glutathione S-transferase [Alphaproteobacteria bacterium]|nr:glutathione S-transferase [Alphaproteobacteria bacterium]MBU0796105.1 glutathione S-transferase [Alphaproteobacteria bacterium]MBU0888476.1 glutathione S-transferase [Alphaproteobacteria bacterium]MBU1813061.1 glutathione S-transferase [Alphaproteobacteria bacterium]MBU2089406.1 glutathione S-transferase [Alphaproteobacteria bacterium]
MKLRYSPTSPYVRKVMVLAIEAGIDGKLDKDKTAASPIERNETLYADNPIGKVPSLTTDDGMTLFDSPVICEYLDAEHAGGKFYPAKGKARWVALRQHAIADGLLDAALLARYEGFMRPEELRWDAWLAGQKGKVASALDMLEKEAGDLDGPITIGQIAVGCALGYMDFRYEADKWREGRPNLAKWYDAFAQRPSMTATVPPK